ncbi:MAG: hypothetical protein EOP52_06530 [Sphingobacteriales bacterium]|nr:MAG: hypothetical protein EOP52_06530 [Sphingobacteriales bacterium]
MLILLIAVPVWLQAAPQKNQTIANDCLSGRANALRDYKGDSLKYYYFGIVGASKETISAARKLGVRAVSSGCMVTEAIQCYNATADSIMYANQKVRLSKLR